MHISWYWHDQYLNMEYYRAWKSISFWKLYWITVDVFFLIENSLNGLFNRCFFSLKPVKPVLRKTKMTQNRFCQQNRCLPIYVSRLWERLATIIGKIFQINLWNRFRCDCLQEFLELSHFWIFLCYCYFFKFGWVVWSSHLLLEISKIFFKLPKPLISKVASCPTSSETTYTFQFSWKWYS